MRRIVAVAFLILLAGCSASAASTSDNPWQKSTVSVSIETPHSESGEYRKLAKEEVNHWENNSQRYASSNVTFELVNESDNADLTIKFFSKTHCNADPSAIGCATLYTADDGRLTSAVVTIEIGFDERHDRELVKSTLRHEIGHAFGMDHSDSEEFPFMSESAKMS